ncbi:hypothetical protein LRS73_28355 [Methylobacterium currus]|uniref:hypothetical protein n=1 Tax=Methylobacterium currus TaxID=2051553 RepID=UPI001E647C1F|nr:hypothetical protein [Methylobacterium currus]UHC16318.1 hypothetical protein LRS73_28355 [Methylobacterium currus]
MLSRIFKQVVLCVLSGLEVRFLGIVIAAYWWDVEVRAGRYAVIILWGRNALKGLYLINGDQERYWEWPWGWPGHATGGREAPAAA